MMILPSEQCWSHLMTFDEIFYVLNQIPDEELENLDENSIIQEHTSNNDSHEKLSSYCH